MHLAHTEEFLKTTFAWNERALTTQATIFSSSTLLLRGLYYSKRPSSHSPPRLAEHKHILPLLSSCWLPRPSSHCLISPNKQTGENPQFANCPGRSPREECWAMFKLTECLFTRCWDFPAVERMSLWISLAVWTLLCERFWRAVKISGRGVIWVNISHSWQN